MVNFFIIKNFNHKNIFKFKQKCVLEKIVYENANVIGATF